MMLKRIVLVLLAVFFLNITVRAIRQRDTSQEDGERSGPIAQLQRLFSGNDEEEPDRSDVDDSGVARDDTSFAPAGGATDPANVDNSGNAEESSRDEESNAAGTGATAEEERSPRQRSNRPENDDANLMW